MLGKTFFFFLKEWKTVFQKIVNLVSVLQKSLRKLKFKSVLMALTHPLQLPLGQTRYRENKMLLTLFTGSSAEEKKRK